MQSGLEAEVALFAPGMVVQGLKSGSSSVLRMWAAPWRQACEAPVVKVVQSMNPQSS